MIYSFRIYDLETTVHSLENQIADLKNQLANQEAIAKVCHEDKLQTEKDYNTLFEKQIMLQEQMEKLTEELLKSREQEIERINKENEAEAK